MKTNKKDPKKIYCSRCYLTKYLFKKYGLRCTVGMVQHKQHVWNNRFKKK